MITKLNTYESVPIGTSNFEDFLSYVRAFLGANFGFSTNIIENDGGYFKDDNFEWVQRGTGSTAAWVFTPVGKPEGNLFGKKNSEYFRFLVLNSEDGSVQSFRWELPATFASESSGHYLLENTSPEDMVLPYRPLRQEGTDEFRYGYHEVRFNGHPQDDITNISIPSGSSFASQRVRFSEVLFGAEFPEPLIDGRFDSSLTKGSAGVTLQEFRDNYGSTLTFPYTNFGIDYGGHILLWREMTDKFVYIPQDTSSGSEPAPGTFRVVDFSRGIIRLNVLNSQIRNLATSELEPLGDIRFLVVSGEQLQEEISGGVVNYHSRYGEVYTGEAVRAQLVSYIFDGQEHLAVPVEDIHISPSQGSVLVSDTAGLFGDSILIAISYPGEVNANEMRRVQETRYLPDVFTFYYSAGMRVSDMPTGPGNNIHALVEHNDASWYNRDVSTADYLPVPRIRSSWYSFITASEAQNVFGEEETFFPSFGFAIIDTVHLQDLANVTDNPRDGDVLVYNETNNFFEGVEYTLNNLRDTYLSSPTPPNRRILMFQTGGAQSGNKWVDASVTTALGYTPVKNSSHGDSVDGVLSYSGDFTLANDNDLITKKYVDSSLSSAVVSVTPEAGTGITITPGTAGAPRISINSNVVTTSRSIVAGDGLTGGGNLSVNRTLSVNNTVVRTNVTQTITSRTTMNRLVPTPSNPGNPDLIFGNTAGQHGLAVYRVSNPTLNDSYPGHWYTIAHIGSGSDHAFQLGGRYGIPGTERLKVRTFNDQGGSWNKWQEVMVAEQGQTITGWKTFSQGSNTPILEIRRRGSVWAAASIRYRNSDASNALSVYAGIGSDGKFTIADGAGLTTSDVNTFLKVGRNTLIKPVDAARPYLTLAYSDIAGPRVILHGSDGGTLVTGSKVGLTWNNLGAHVPSVPNIGTAVVNKDYVDSKVSESSANVSVTRSGSGGTSSGYATNNIIRIGDFFIVTSSVQGSGSGGRVDFTGPTLPAGTYDVISCNVQPMSNNAHNRAYGIGFVQDMTRPHVNSNRKPVARIKVQASDAVGAGQQISWAALVTWFIWKKS